MFTGIITATAKIAAMDIRNSQRVIQMSVPYKDVTLGESIALNGVCLTIARLEPIATGTNVEFFVSPETCARTNLGRLGVGTQVNLERALQLSDRLSGHLVQGHVDGLARLTGVRATEDCWELAVELPAALCRYVVEKGSITLDGVSLTINKIENSTIYLMIIPHTWSHTALSARQLGDDLNVEVDVIAKYAERLMRAYAHNT
jgi:riboflavin synthase